eukprot:1195192-Prorocentrum_minimum.AAC.2
MDALWGSWQLPLEEGVRRGSGEGQEGVRRGSGGVQKGVRRLHQWGMLSAPGPRSARAGPCPTSTPSPPGWCDASSRTRTCWRTPN